MKKFVSGVIVGLLLFTGASVFADSASLIGQKVQGLFTLEKGGEKIADAVIINGSTYAPVRALADATNTNLTVKGKTIVVGEIAQETIVPPAVGVSDTTLKDLKAKRETISGEIIKLQTQIKGAEETIIPQYEQLAKENANIGSIGKQSQESADYWKAQVDKYKEQLADLQKQLADLDAQIAAL